MTEIQDTKNLLKFVWKYFASHDEDTIIIRKSLIDLCQGSHTTALLISQLLYWHNKYKDMDRWMKITYEEWHEQVRLTERKLKTSLKQARTLNFIETKIKRFNGLSSLHLRVNFECLTAALIDYEKNFVNGRNVQTAQDETSKPVRTKRTNDLTETTTETTTEKKLTNCESSSSFIFSQTTDKNILNQKLDRDTRTDEEFLEAALDHVENHSNKKYPRLQRAGALVKLLKQHKADNKIFYVAGTQPKDPTPEDKKPAMIKHFTEEEESLLAEYKHYLKVFSHEPVDKWFPKEEKRNRILAIYAREQELINGDQGRMQASS